MLAAATQQEGPGAPSAPPVTLKLLIEGEEESGSPHFAALLRDRAATLACDVIVVSDTTMWAADVPSMCTSMRGLAETEVTLTGPSRDLHSGSFGGGVPNPLDGQGPDHIDLVVTGTGFQHGAVVWWDDRPLTTHFIGPTRLEARVPFAFLSVNTLKAVRASS